MKISLLLGAGASTHLGMPTTKEFKKILQEQPFYKDLKEILPMQEMEDIEVILYELEKAAKEIKEAMKVFKLEVTKTFLERVFRYSVIEIVEGDPLLRGRTFKCPNYVLC